MSLWLSSNTSAIILSAGTTSAAIHKAKLQHTPVLSIVRLEPQGHAIPPFLCMDFLCHFKYDLYYICISPCQQKPGTHEQDEK